MLLRVVLEILFVLALMGDGVYLIRVGWPSLYPDRMIGWFMLSIGAAAIGSHLILALFASGLLRGELAGWLYAVALTGQVGAIWFRAWMSWQAAPRMRGSDDGQMDSGTGAVLQGDPGNDGRRSRRRARGTDQR